MSHSRHLGWNWNVRFSYMKQVHLPFHFPAFYHLAHSNSADIRNFQANSFSAPKGGQLAEGVSPSPCTTAPWGPHIP